MRRVIGLLLGIMLSWVTSLDAGEFRFPEIAGWRQSGEIQTFSPKTLYEYINGAADLYLACDFEELKVAEYVNEKKASVIVEAYRHRTSRDSYFIGSKASLPQDRTTGRCGEGATAAEFLKKLDLSLKRLGIDHVDILYHHNVSPYNYQQKHVAEVRDAIARAAQAGLGIVGMKAIRVGYRQTPSVRNSAAVLKWVLQDPHVHTIVPGFTTFDQLEVDLSLELPPEVCGECTFCPVRCAIGFPVREKIRDIVRIREIPTEFIV